MLVITLIIIIQVIILEIQKFVGPKFILPKFLKKMPYNYYLSQKEEEEVSDPDAHVLSLYNIYLKIPAILSGNLLNFKFTSSIASYVWKNYLMYFLRMTI